MNETLFLLHLVIAAAFLYPFMKMGKSGLMCWICLQPILANLFVLKQIHLFGLTVTCSDVYAVSCALGLNMLQEYYGKDVAKKAVWCSFMLLVFFVVMAGMHLLYTASADDYTQGAYTQILSSTPRLVGASIVSFLVVQWFDVQFYGFLKTRFKKLSLFGRNITSLSVSQFIDTVLFTVLGLWGLVSELFDVFLVSFVIKLTIALLLSLSTMRKQTHAHVSV
jgi:queuosine precursor transporter